jgi:hypothetical protein
MVGIPLKETDISTLPFGHASETLEKRLNY